MGKGKEGRWGRKKEKREGGRNEDLSKAHVVENSTLQGLRSLKSLPT